MYIDKTRYYYQVRYSFNPRGYTVVKVAWWQSGIEEVLAHSLTRETAMGFIKLFKE
jgi:hypothetical protein